MNLSGIDANRREIASAACALVARDGLHSVSLRRIAKSLGSTTGYISHYYVDKEDLLEAALSAALDEITSRVEPQSTTLEEWIDRAVGTLPRDGESQRFWRVLTAFQSASLNSPRLAEVLRVYVAGEEAVLAHHLAAVLGGEVVGGEVVGGEVVGGEVVGDDPAAPGVPTPPVAALARSLFALVSGLGTTLTITPDAFTEAQQRSVVRSAVFALVDEFAGR